MDTMGTVGSWTPVPGLASVWTGNRQLFLKLFWIPIDSIVNFFYKTKWWVIYNFKKHQRFYCLKNIYIFNKPGVDRAVLQTPFSLIHSLSNWAFPSKPSKHHYTQTVRARKRKFWENIHPPLCVTCQVSGVTCQVSHVRFHMSGVTCQVSHVRWLFFDKVVGLVSGGFVINGAYPV